MNDLKTKKVQRSVSWILGCVLLISAAGHKAFAINVLYLDRSNGQLDTRQQIETVSHFYGLDVDCRFLESHADISAALRTIADAKTIAVIISAEALSTLNRDEVFKLTHRRRQKTPILIAGINAHTSSSLLYLWSSRKISGARSSPTQSGSWYEIAPRNDVTQQLGSSKLPLNQRQVNSLIVERTSSLIEARSVGSSLPVFVRTLHDDNEVFFSAEVQAYIPATPNPYRQQAIFAPIASLMMFIKYAADERAWHSPGDYANFTIDDLWLREPYGHVNFEDLLREAQIHNFHATIAFIPWNYDRSQPEMASLFREHTDRLSICVHGNNHVHQEFGSFDKHPLDTQEKDIQQALARMDRFKQLTKVSYDPVMVFPHSISPEETLAALKRANYLATVNSLNVPSDATTPPDTDFALRASSLHFANFPSLRRYSAESDVQRTQLAIDAFLGNPMLFYAHESFFASGINAFDPVAEMVNQLQPDTQWRSLGDIVQHLYLERLRDDGNVDVRISSSSIHLSNKHERDAIFFVEKEEDFYPLPTVFVDGQKYPFERDGTKLRLRLPIAKRESKLIEVKYLSNVAPWSLSNLGAPPRVTAIRLLSDFRDNVVSNTSFGRRLIRSYADGGSRWNRRIVALMLFLGALISGVYIHKLRKVPLIRPVS
ncbi:hypothetical protein [Granulicella sp. dw_53]|uniref:hypothetical protein n=1 Tax=Granulicella sp. dw_53 TaxID=2719792 RepID=UPI001BD44FE8|nr:hypothetical protein [Granulicella sp. dw_53]